MIDLTFQRKMRPKYSFQVSVLAFSRPPSEPGVKKQAKINSRWKQVSRIYSKVQTLRKLKRTFVVVVIIVVVVVVVVVVNQTIQNMRKLLG